MPKLDPPEVPHQSVDIEAEQLILAAFGQAAERGRDPSRMQAGALKNRILGLTARTFDESAWGARSFLEFLALFPSTVAIDRTVQPPAVELKVTDPTLTKQALEHLESSPVRFAPAHGPVPDEGWRIRRDLWTAVLDVSGESVWVWDGATAIPLDADDVDPIDARKRLPTLSEESLHKWRAEFVSQQPTSDGALTQALETWRDRRETSWSLPQPVRGIWFGSIKSQVRNHLLSWFEEHDLALPQDFYEARPVSRPRTTEDERLRDLVTRCVARMTAEELRALPLPATAILRLLES